MMKKRILIIDDEPELAQLISIFLGTAGFEVLSTYDGRQALEMLEQLPPDLVICDMIMPVMDGVATIQAIRANPRMRSIPIIMLSARGQVRDIERALSAGANDYITKPFHSTEIVATVKKNLKEQPSNALMPVHEH